MGNKKRKRQNATNGEHRPALKKQHMDQVMPDGVSHYRRIHEVPSSISHYWKHRFDIFSLYNQGIWMTDDAWFGVTPESVAKFIAYDIAEAVPDGRSIIIDTFCGAGGNTIAFALSGKWKRVYAIEKDAATLACAKHNAEIYGVHDKITWFHGDCFELLGTGENAVDALKAVIGGYGVVFASPPWGGPGYKSQDIFDLDTMEPYSLNHIVKSLSVVTKNMVLFLPRTSDLERIADEIEQGKQGQVRHYCVNGRSKGLCAYLGDWKKIEERWETD